MRKPDNRLVALGAATMLAMSLGACAGTNPSTEAAESPTSAFPVTVINCSNEIVFDRAPERVVVFRNEVIPVLSSLDVMDRVVGTVGRFHEAYFDDDTLAQLSEVPSLSDQISAVGGGEISLEDVLSVEPDLVIGTSSTVTREALLSHGIKVLENEESCQGSQATSTLEDIDTLFALYATVFDRQSEATAALEDIERQIASAVANIAPGENRTAAMLYPTIGGGPVYAYGSGSMNHTLLKMAGFENAFADIPDRTVEVSVEDLLDRDPDVLILLHSGASNHEVIAAIRALPDSDQLTAVTEGQLMPLLFGYASPASPITVKGLELIVENFRQ